MRVLHITNNNYDGAGRAVMRFHKSLLELGIDSNVALVFCKNAEKDNKILRIGYGETLKTFLLDLIAFKIALNYSNYLDIFYFLRIKIYEKVFLTFHKPTSLYNFNYGFSRHSQLKKYIKDYDVIVLHSLQGVLNPNDIVQIHKEFKVKIIIHPLDMEAITGGCHFNDECGGWKQLCGNCPQIKSNKFQDASMRSFTDKKNSYKHIPIHWVATNTFMQKRLIESPIVSSSHKVSKILLGVDSDRYQFISQRIARDSFGLPKDKKIILFGCFNLSDKRKGAALLKEVLREHLNKECLENACLVTFGNLNGFSFSGLDLEWIHLGELLTDSKMNYLYRSADLLASPSTDDLGPAIVVEAFMNDLQIVSFNLGVAMDIIIDDVNGNIIECFNLKKFGLSISNIIINEVKNFRLHKDIKGIYKQCKSNEEASIFIEKCL
jgi:glycosyltransferase involved in cell wall biosynthesis